MYTPKGLGFSPSWPGESPNSPSANTHVLPTLFLCRLAVPLRVCMHRVPVLCVPDARDVLEGARRPCTEPENREAIERATGSSRRHDARFATLTARRLLHRQ